MTEAASYQAHPQDYLNEQLDRLKQAGVNSMAMYESTLDDFRKAGHVVTYTTQNIADMEKRVSPPMRILRTLFSLIRKALRH